MWFKIGEQSQYIQNESFSGVDLEADAFDFETFKINVLHFLDSMNIDGQVGLYRYSATCSEHTLYASAYACMTLSLFRELDHLHVTKR